MLLTLIFSAATSTARLRLREPSPAFYIPQWRGPFKFVASVKSS